MANRYPVTSQLAGLLTSHNGARGRKMEQKGRGAARSEQR